MPDFDLLKAQRQVWDSRIRSPEKLVMLALLDHWSKASTAPFPSVGRLAWMTTQSKSTVLRAIATLESTGAIVVQRRNGTSSAYSLHPNRCQRETGVTERPVSERNRTGVRVTPPPVSERHHSKEPREGTQEGTHIGATHEPPTSTKPAKTKARKRPKPKPWKFVPDDWAPHDAHRSKARELGVNLDEQLALFRAHEFRTPKTDADRAFSGWLTRAASWGTARGSRSGVPRVQMTIDPRCLLDSRGFDDDEPEVTP